MKGLNFDLGESIALLRESVRGFAQAEIAPIAAQVDRDNQFPRAIWPKLGALGLLGITIDLLSRASFCTSHLSIHSNSPMMKPRSQYLIAAHPVLE